MLCVPMAFGQGVDAVRFNTVDWLFVPAVAANDDILGFLSWTDTGIVGQNISLMWYEYDANTGSFTTFAWKHTDVGAAAIWLRQNYSEDNMFAMNDDLPSFIATADAANIIAPKPFTNGLFDDDPLAPVVSGSQDPQPIIDALATIGYAAAPSVSGMAVATGGSSGNVMVGQNPVPIDVACIVAAGSLEAMMLNDLYNRAQSLVTFGVDLPGNRSCSWPCTCVITVAYTPTGPWATGTTPLGNCQYTRTANKTVTKTGLYWYFLSCTGTTTTAGFQFSNELGPNWPPAPTSSTLPWSHFPPAGYPIP